MSAFANDDTYNVVAEHVIEALVVDVKLKAKGALAITTWEQEFREDVEQYNDNELPLIAVTCDLSSQEEENTQQDRTTFVTTVWVVTGGGRLQNVTQSVKHYAARVERVMQQQHDTSKQLASVTADLADAQAGSVAVNKIGTAIGGGPAGESFRGVAVLTFGVSIDFTITID